MKDDEVEDLFAWGWEDTAVAIAVVCVILVIGFFEGDVI
jgi:hypothetical protein